jgi:hypothetical protein
VARRNAENVLVAFSRPFKGVCNKCGKRGHKAVDCRVPVNDANAAQGQRLYNDQKKFMGTCHYCKKANHKAIDGRKKKANEAGNLAIDNGPEQMVFSAFDNDITRNKRVQSANESVGTDMSMKTTLNNDSIMMTGNMGAKIELSSSSNCFGQQGSDSESSQDWTSVRRLHQPKIMDFVDDIDREWVPSIEEEFGLRDQHEALKNELRGTKHQLEESDYYQQLANKELKLVKSELTMKNHELQNTRVHVTQLHETMEEFTSQIEELQKYVYEMSTEMQEKYGRDSDEVLFERIAKEEHTEHRRKQLCEEAAVFQAAHEERRERHALRLLGLDSDDNISVLRC